MREGGISKNTEVDTINSTQVVRVDDSEDKISARSSKDKTRIWPVTCQRGLLGEAQKQEIPASIIQESRFKVRTKARAWQPHPEKVASNLCNHEQPSKTSWDPKTGRDRTRALGPVSAFTRDSHTRWPEAGSCLDKSALSALSLVSMDTHGLLRISSRKTVTGASEGDQHTPSKSRRLLVGK